MKQGPLRGAACKPSHIGLKNCWLLLEEFNIKIRDLKLNLLRRISKPNIRFNNIKSTFLKGLRTKFVIILQTHMRTSVTQNNVNKTFKYFIYAYSIFNIIMHIQYSILVCIFNMQYYYSYSNHTFGIWNFYNLFKEKKFYHFILNFLLHN